MSEKSVTNLEFWNSLCANGIKPPTHKSSYVERVQKHLWEIFGIERQQCSEATCTDIDKQAVKFCKSAVYNWGKAGSSYPRMEKRAFLLDNTISVKVEPISNDIPELAAAGPSRSGHQGPYKTFQEKGKSGQDKAVAAVKTHPPEAILKAAPAAASALGKPVLATAIRMMEKQPEVLPAKAISGMKDKDSMYNLSNSLQAIMVRIFDSHKFFSDRSPSISWLQCSMRYISPF